MRKSLGLVLALAGALAVGPAMAKKGGGDGERGDRDDRKGHRESNERGERGERREGREHFNDTHRTSVREYYEGQFQSGRCPPGLAKKHNGCMPPGQAKKWEIGRPLPRDVRFYEVPRPLVSQLGAPPAGYHYVRVGSDILLVSDRSSLIADIIRNLGIR